MKIAEIMSVDVALAAPDQSLKQAADLMATKDIGSLPVGDHGKLVGMLTDRDIACRGVARGLGADARVGDVMNEQVRYCYQDQEVDEVARNMADLQLRRMPVVNREKDLVGIVSLADFAHSGQTASADGLMKGVAVPHH